jgi:hypothetical protein
MTHLTAGRLCGGILHHLLPVPTQDLAIVAAFGVVSSYEGDFGNTGRWHGKGCDIVCECASTRIPSFGKKILPGGLRDLSTVKCARNIFDVPADIIESNRQHRFPSALGA